MQLKAENITKIIGGNTIFKDLSIEVNTGERIAIVGRNGSGKTTLFKVLADIEQPDEGRIIKSKGQTIGYLHQIPRYTDTSVFDVLSRAFAELHQIKDRLAHLEKRMATDLSEKILNQYGELQEHYLAKGGYEIEAKIASIANGLAITKLLDQPFDALSGGEKTKVMLAQILLQQPDILLLDEPTNHLDLAATQWLEDYLQYFRGTVVVISHDRMFLNKIVQYVAEIEDGQIWVSKGNYDQYINNKEAKIAQQFAAYEEQQKKIQKMKEAIRRLRQWANEASPPNPDLYRKAKVMEKMLARMEIVKKPKTERHMNLQLKTEDRTGKEVFMLKNISHGFEHDFLFMDVDLSIHFQDRVAIVGNNGTGKSTLLKILLGEITPVDGEARQGSNLKIGYLAQQFDQLNGKQRLIDAFREQVSLTEYDARHMLAKFLFYGHDVFKKVDQLSGGEKMRLRLAQLMIQKCNVLVLDEPTNHLDIESREALEEALENFEGTILAISHDRYFLQKLFTRTAWLENQQLTVHDGPFEWAQSKQKELSK
ncbi:ATPase component of ABC transporters with duplicated ATPase domains [Solibacillus silvestris StLB046]|uniref:ATPase component of ABC transporters with duplicated ATPase domains n=1 Tax=Solibacillus silvestris (strain StLB046) TaxID=1002809 RepID=F2F5X6_SOLSS|nr:ABC-F type ribosomal protection protein [Solibacillus silvestris]BAK17059.1 ATPase component of ABC transporters with duplicated ATPase domains [Solibacillus silvestris StLB046]